MTKDDTDGSFALDAFERSFEEKMIKKIEKLEQHDELIWKLQMEAEANQRNIIHLKETIEDLTGKLNDAKNRIVTLTMNTVAKESFEREKKNQGESF